MHVNALEHRECRTSPYLFMLLHLITQNITFYGCPYEEIIKELLMWASQIRSYPDILGEFGS